MPLGKLRRASIRKSSTKGHSAPSVAEAELMASRSTAHRLSSQSVDSEEDLSNTGSGASEPRHRLASNGSQRRLSNEETVSSTLNSSGSQRRYTVHSSNGSCRSRSGSVDGCASDLSTNSDFKGKRRASLFTNGLAGGSEARVVRVFFRNETYRSVRFLEEESCGDVLNRLWPRLDLNGESLDYMFYIIYKKEGHRFAGDDESADVLLGSDWREVEKIYLRHRDDTVAVKRVAVSGDGETEVMLKRSKSKKKESVRKGGVAPNPFAKATGDSHTVHVEAERPMSKFAQAFSMAWETAEQLEDDEGRSKESSPPASPLKFDPVNGTVAATGVADQLKTERRKSSTDSGRGSLERKLQASTEYPDSGHSSLTSEHRRSISSIAADSGLCLHQDLDSPMLRKALSRSSMGSSGGSPRSTAVISRYSQHASVSKLSFAPLDGHIGDAPIAPTAPKLSTAAVTSPGSHYSVGSDSSPPSPLPPPPPVPELSAPYSSRNDKFSSRFPAPPSPGLPPPPSSEELKGLSRMEFSFSVTNNCGVDV